MIDFNFFSVAEAKLNMFRRKKQRKQRQVVQQSSSWSAKNYSKMKRKKHKKKGKWLISYPLLRMLNSTIRNLIIYVLIVPFFFRSGNMREVYTIKGCLAHSHETEDTDKMRLPQRTRKNIIQLLSLGVPLSLIKDKYLKPESFGGITGKIPSKNQNF